MSDFVSPQRVEAFCKSLQVSPRLLLLLRQMMRRRFPYKSTCPGQTSLASHFLSHTHTHPVTLLNSTHTHFPVQSKGIGPIQPR